MLKKINAYNAGGHIRTAEEIRGKFLSYTRDTKKRIAQNRKESARTGGGRVPPTELTLLQEKVSRILGDTPLMALTAELIPQRAALAPLETEKFHVMPFK